MGISYDNKTVLYGTLADDGFVELEVKPLVVEKLMDVKKITPAITPVKTYPSDAHLKELENDRWMKWFVDMFCESTAHTSTIHYDVAKIKQEGEKDDMMSFKNESRLIYVSDEILDFAIVKENKVVRVLFKDGICEKMVCHEEDTFDLKQCLYIAIAKHLYKDTYTFEGIEYKAKEISYQKKYVKMVNKAIANYKVEKARKEKMRKDEEERKRAIANKKRKHAEYLKRREQKRLAVQAKAICEGLKLYDTHDKNQ